MSPPGICILEGNKWCLSRLTVIMVIIMPKRPDAVATPKIPASLEGEIERNVEGKKQETLSEK
jgi:hypothetical protein